MVAPRSREYHASGIHNVDICVTTAASREFPRNMSQCFRHGYDFSGLSIRWRSPTEVTILFSCGRVSSFSNYAVLAPRGSNPVEFHAVLLDECSKDSKTMPEADRELR